MGARSVSGLSGDGIDGLVQSFAKRRTLNVATTAPRRRAGSELPGPGLRSRPCGTAMRYQLSAVVFRISHFSQSQGTQLRYRSTTSLSVSASDTRSSLVLPAMHRRPCASSSSYCRAMTIATSSQRRNWRCANGGHSWKSGSVTAAGRCDRGCCLAFNRIDDPARVCAALRHGNGLASANEAARSSALFVRRDAVPHGSGLALCNRRAGRLPRPGSRCSHWRWLSEDDDGQFRHFVRHRLPVKVV